MRGPGISSTVLLLLLRSLPGARGVLPTGVLSLDLLPQTPHEPPAFAEQLCSPSAAAGWGVALPARHDSRWKTLMQLPAANRDGCASYQLPNDAATSVHGTVVVVDRGNCSFVAKAQKAQAAGAKGLIVRGTKRAVYEAVISHNTTNASSVPSGNAAGAPGVANLAVVTKPVFEFDCGRGEAFVDRLADPVWKTDAEECSGDHRCESRSCVLTGHTVMQESSKKHQVCCMWDTFVLMGATNRSVTKELAIPVVYVTIANGQKLQKAMDKYPTSLVARTYRREPPLIDVSSLLLWAIGVVTALGATCYSASSLRHQNETVAAREQRKLRDEPNSQLEEEGERDRRDDIWELDARHAVGFIALAGVFLTVFYYVKIGGAIPVLFAVSGAATLTQVVMMPAVEWLMPSSGIREVTIPLLGDTTRLSEVLGLIPSVTIAVVWYLHRRTFWALQDIMGISLCFVFLRTVQLPNLKVATVLLTLAFCYDVFFVFLSPIFFGSSVMEDVATGGPAAYTKSGYPGVDYCERYPKYPACVDPEPMPMLLVLPRVLDWAGGVSMLGLGDIILPGMLLSFTLRFDYSQGSTNYFRLMAIGYAVGLALANLAVMITEMGQPALMYLVPTTLGTLIVASKRNGDFRALWIGAGIDEDDLSSMKRRSSDGPAYRAVGSEEPPMGIVIGDPIGRVNDNSRGDHVPLLSSSSS
ncbi:putative signal peptide peptidase-like, aspartyl protease family A22B [Phytophthora cinnamomi]|uniref:putative signal peptide peptidase-like, aspartyl protease family A22B n=1 Tax=Phytophthora cinnamomi TaxID=4785 RepID=UPI00355A71C2|nr:putative signal peptide peptidase-like, aspartyl protease family A22B [Phytophthora cinnamomi]